MVRKKTSFIVKVQGDVRAFQMRYLNGTYFAYFNRREKAVKGLRLQNGDKLKVTFEKLGKNI